MPTRRTVSGNGGRVALSAAIWHPPRPSFGNWSHRVIDASIICQPLIARRRMLPCEAEKCQGAIQAWHVRSSNRALARFASRTGQLKALRRLGLRARSLAICRFETRKLAACKLLFRRASHWKLTHRWSLLKGRRSRVRKSLEWTWHPCLGFCFDYQIGHQAPSAVHQLDHSFPQLRTHSWLARSNF